MRRDWQGEAGGARLAGRGRWGETRRASEADRWGETRRARPLRRVSKLRQAGATKARQPRRIREVGRSATGEAIEARQAIMRSSGEPVRTGE